MQCTSAGQRAKQQYNSRAELGYPLCGNTFCRRTFHTFARPAEDFPCVQVAGSGAEDTGAAGGRKGGEGERRRERRRETAREEKEDAVRGAVARDAQTARGCAKLRPAC